MPVRRRLAVASSDFPVSAMWNLVTYRCPCYDDAMLKTIPFLLAVTTAVAFAQDLDKDTTQIWNLEKAYWDYVKANDLEKYRALWHENFLGWPPASSAPVRKVHVTDWLTANRSKGVKLESYAIEQVAIQVTGDIGVVHYRIKMEWSGPKPTDNETETIRVHHTWLRSNGTWEILAGMGAPVNAEGK